jgi:hypothetical protein
MEQNPYEANSHSVGQVNSMLFIELKGSLLCSQKPATGTYLEPVESIPYPISVTAILILSSHLSLGPRSGVFPVLLCEDVHFSCILSCDS